MRPRPFRGILGAALLLCGLGPDLQPPPRAPPRPEEIEALAVELTGAGINTLELAEHVGQDLHEFVRVGRQCLGIFKMLLAQGQRVTVVADLVRKHDELVGAIPAAGTERAIRLGGDRSLAEGPVRFHAKPRFRGQPLPVGHGTVGVLEIRGRRGPGLQLREERERVGEPLRILAAYTHMTVVELSDIERGQAIPTPEQWAALQDALPNLGPMEAPPTEAERSPVLPVGDREAAMREAIRPGWAAPALARDLRREVDAARLERLLHPAGRCTCGVGGFGGTCDWCVMDRRRMLREARHVRRTERDQDEPRRDVVLASVIESERKEKRRKARAKVKARRGW